MNKKNSDFTVRELDVLNFLVNGDSNNVIAEKLCITNHTVKAHLTQIYKKLGVTNRVQAAIKSMQMGIEQYFDIEEIIEDF